MSGYGDAGSGYGYGYAEDDGAPSSYGFGNYGAVRNPAYRLTYPGQTISYSYSAYGAYYSGYAHENLDGTTYSRLSTSIYGSGEYLRSTQNGYPSTGDMRRDQSTAYRLQSDGSSYYERTTQASYFYHPGEYSITDHYKLTTQADGASTAYASTSYDHNYLTSVKILKNYETTYTDASGQSSYSYGTRYTYLPPSGPHDEVVITSHSP